MPTLRKPALFCLLLLAFQAAAEEPLAFATQPSMEKRADGSFTLRFGVNRLTDVAVSILDAKGAVIRHLAAGLLGPNAPEPLQKNATAQVLTWDGKDDLGQPAAGGPFKARVSAGVRPELEKVCGWSGQTFAPIAGLAVGPGGELFALTSDAFHGRSEVRVFDRQGKYLRTIVPYPANTPKERTDSIGHLEVEGERLPIVFNGHTGNLHPLMAGMKNQSIGVHPKGHLLLASAIGTMAEHGPPRHLLALDFRGGAPNGIPFVGPQFQAPRGFLGSSAEGPSRCFDHLAASPDGEWVYFVPWKLSPKDEDSRRVLPLRHAVFRLKWNEKELGAPWLGKDKEPGSDDAHFNEPQGLAVDKHGNVFVCDRGNHRVMVFSSAGKLLGKIPVEQPLQIGIHSADGSIYLFSKAPGKQVKTAHLLKFSAWGAAAPRELARLVLAGAEVFAVDAEAQPPRIWIGKGRSLQPVLDQGGKLELGKAIEDHDAGLEYPLFVAADPAHRRILVREKPAGYYQLDLDSGKMTELKIKGTDAALDRDGNIYMMDGYNTNSLSRFKPDGKPLPFSGLGTHKINLTYRGYGPNIGLRGHCVGMNGDLYVICSTNYGDEPIIGSRVHCFGPDGKMKKESLIDGLGYGDCGLGVDAAGNLYVGANVKPKARPYPDAFMGKVPEAGWIWWRKEKREVPWHYTYYHPYLFHWGAVFKFPPTGGAFYGQDITEREVKRKQAVISAANAPAGALALASAYLGREVKVHGALWYRHGSALVPSSSDGPAPDPGCVCFDSHLAADPYGRVYTPNVFRYSVEMFDTNGNPVARIGRYGNADSAGPGSPVPEPSLAFAWPAFLSYAEEKLYVSDSINRRVTIVRLAYAASAECELR